MGVIIMKKKDNRFRAISDSEFRTFCSEVGINSLEEGKPLKRRSIAIEVAVCVTLIIIIGVLALSCIGVF